MESILEAIESSHRELKEEEEAQLNGNEPQYSFAFRPPQWCIVDKWFSMQVLCSNENTRELEAFVYNSEGATIPDILQAELTNDPLGKRIIVSVDKSHKATFRVKFVAGSKGAWLHIGIGIPNRPDKCLLKSPPIKVQTNRSKRPRDSKKKPVPVVNSLSPNSVPSIGNFPGRKDRMLLIFGANFHLWGTTPVVNLIQNNGKEVTEIRPPNLIWWSENLLECQVPECSSDLEVKVANYDMVFGDGKVLKVEAQEDMVVEQANRPIGNSQVLLEYSASDRVEDPTPKGKVMLHNRGVSADQLIVETSAGVEQLSLHQLSAVIRIYNKITDKIILEEGFKCDSTASSNSDYITFLFNLNNLDKSKLAQASEAVYIMTHMRNDKNNQLLIDPFTKQPLQTEKPFFASSPSESDDDEPSTSTTQTTSNVSVPPSSPQVAHPGTSASPSPAAHTANTLKIEDLKRMQLDTAHGLDITLARTSLLNYISKCEDMETLQRWEQMLDESLQELRAHKQALQTRQQLQQLRKDLATPPPQISVAKQEEPTSMPTIIAPKPVQQIKELKLSSSGEYDDDDDEPDAKRGKLNGGETKQEVSLAIQDPKNGNGLVYWKFFNPGNRTFLDLVDGKLQIIGSRRIQMLIESIPVNSKFVNAQLYVQKDGNYEAIENCARCKENGIPNVFCILPRRGREHDFPWITFRITCTSTAKHWKGSLFWIGAEFLVDPTQGNTIKVFSPPIYVQSKIKTKDLAASGERSGSPELVRTKSAESIKPPSPSVSPAPPVTGLPINVTSAINATIANNPQALNGVTGGTPSTNFHVRAASILEALKTGSSISATVTSAGLVRTRSSEGIKPSVVTPMVTAAISQAKQGLPPALSLQQVQQIARGVPPLQPTPIQASLSPFPPVHTVPLVNKPASPQPIPTQTPTPTTQVAKETLSTTTSMSPPNPTDRSTLANPGPVEVQIKSQ